MTDYKQLCAELLAALEEEASNWNLTPEDHPLVKRARAALAEPEPEGPTDAELLELMPQQMRDDLAAAARALAGFDPDNIKASSVFRIILNRHIADHSRAVLTRWGNHLGFPDSSTQPIPVSERLPVAENWNADGEVWAWRRFNPEGDMDNGDHWMLAFHEWLEDEDCGFTHWLPANALPLPS